MENKSSLKVLKGTLILVLAALLWGLAFVAQTKAADVILPFTFNASRSFLGALTLITYIKIRDKISEQKSSDKSSDKSSKQRLLSSGIICGALLFIAINFQQFGIALYPDGVPASGRAGFITAMYIVFVALYTIIKSRKFSIIVIVSTIMSMVGLYFLCFTNGLSGFYLGDVLGLLCAITFTFHILVIDKYNDVDSAKLSFMQFAVCGLLSLLFAIVFEDNTWRDLLAAAIPILYAGILSSGIGYTLQIAGQKLAPPNIAAIAMSLESVFSVVFGVLILGEAFTSREIIGCVLMFSAVIIAQLKQDKN